MIKPIIFSALTVLASTLVVGVDAFMVPQPAPSLKPSAPGAGADSSTRIFVADFTGWDSFERMKNLKTMPSGEEQRKFRRTVYSHDDWKKHRRQERFVVYLAAIFKSGVYKNLANEVILATAIATFVCLWNCFVGGYTDLAGVDHSGFIDSPLFPKIGLPMSMFTLTSPSLGLLLVFRTNTSYQRWDEARKNWGMNINHTRDLVRMANAYYDSTGVSQEQRDDDLNHVALCTWSFVRCMKRHLSPEEEDESNFRVELYDKLPQKQAEMIINAAHRPNRALQDLSYAIDDLPMHFVRKNEIHRAVTIFEDNLGSSERILTSPVPLFYSRHLARYLAVWLFLLPFGIYEAFGKTWNHFGMIPAMTVVATMLFGIEEIGTQLEEPFTVLPMQAFCDKIYNWCMEISSWSPGDNGRAMNTAKPEHAYFTSGPSTTGAPINGSSANGYAPLPEPLYYVEPEPDSYAEPSPESQPYVSAAQPESQQPPAPVQQEEPVNTPPPQNYDPPKFSAPEPKQSTGFISMEDFLKNQGK